jgi:hypothetical protein
MTEEWRSISGFEGNYEVSDHGRICSLDRVITYPDGHLHRLKGQILSPGVQPPFGHLHVNLKTQQRKRSVAVHALVLEAFVGKRPEGQECLHGDGDPSNNKLENLRWGTRTENILDMVRHGTHWQAKKTHCPQGHPYDEENTIVGKNGGRACYACKQANWRARPLKPPQTHCRRGHLYGEANTHMTDRGRLCLTCFSARRDVRREVRLNRAA